jgi:hypothetical protein
MPMSMGTDLLNIGTAQMNLNLNTEAIETFLSARKIFKEDKNPEYVNFADQFLSIVYAMLVENQGYQFDSCAIASEVIKQEVGVTSGEQVFNLTYSLSVVDQTLGVEAAGISNGAPQQNV